MKVKQLEEKYGSIQSRAGDIRSRIAPILKELKKLGREASSLAYKADLDKSLYRVDEKSGQLVEDGWNIAILSRLAYADVGAAVAEIDDALRGIVDTPFVRRKKGNEVKQ